MRPAAPKRPAPGQPRSKAPRAATKASKRGSQRGRAAPELPGLDLAAEQGAEQQRAAEAYDACASLEVITELLEVADMLSRELQKAKSLALAPRAPELLDRARDLLWVLATNVRGVSSRLTGLDVEAPIGSHIALLDRELRPAS